MSDECLMKQEMVFSFYIVYQAVMRKFTLAKKAAGGHLGHHQGRGLLGKLLQQVHNLAQGDVVGHGAIAVAAVGLRQHGQAIELAAVLAALEGGNHLVHKVVDVQQFQLHRRVVHGVRQLARKSVAEGGHRTVVVGPAPLAKQVGEAVDEHPRARLPAVLEEQLLARPLAAPVLAVAKPPSEARLLTAAQHHRTRVAVPLEGTQQRGCKPEIPLHELLCVLRPVDPGQVENEICVFAVEVEF